MKPPKIRQMLIWPLAVVVLAVVSWGVVSYSASLGPCQCNSTAPTTLTAGVHHIILSDYQFLYFDNSDPENTATLYYDEGTPDGTPGHALGAYAAEQNTSGQVVLTLRAYNGTLLNQATLTQVCGSPARYTGTGTGAWPGKVTLSVDHCFGANALTVQQVAPVGSCPNGTEVYIDGNATPGWCVNQGGCQLAHNACGNVVCNIVNPGACAPDLPNCPSPYMVADGPNAQNAIAYIQSRGLTATLVAADAFSPCKVCCTPFINTFTCGGGQTNWVWDGTTWNPTHQCNGNATPGTAPPQPGNCIGDTLSTCCIVPCTPNVQPDPTCPCGGWIKYTWDGGQWNPDNTNLGSNCDPGNAPTQTGTCVGDVVKVCGVAKTNSCNPTTDPNPTCSANLGWTSWWWSGSAWVQQTTAGPGAVAGPAPTTPGNCTGDIKKVCSTACVGNVQPDPTCTNGCNFDTYVWSQSSQTWTKTGTTSSGCKTSDTPQSSGACTGTTVKVCQSPITCADKSCTWTVQGGKWVKTTPCDSVDPSNICGENVRKFIRSGDGTWIAQDPPCPAGCADPDPPAKEDYPDLDTVERSCKPSTGTDPPPSDASKTVTNGSNTDTVCDCPAPTIPVGTSGATTQTSCSQQAKCGCTDLIAANWEKLQKTFAKRTISFRAFMPDGSGVSPYVINVPLAFGQSFNITVDPRPINWPAGAAFDAVRLIMRSIALFGVAFIVLRTVYNDLMKW